MGRSASTLSVPTILDEAIYHRYGHKRWLTTLASTIVLGAEARFPIKYDDPKAFDGTDLMDAKYAERSLQIGPEMAYVFGNV